MMPPAVSSEREDAALVQAWADGDGGAYATIVDRYLDLVYARCRRSLAPADADDATQAVFLVLLRKGPHGPVAQRLAAWLFTTADFVVRDALRQLRRRHRRYPELDVDAMPTPEEPPMNTDLNQALEEALADLPAKEREAIRLHHLAGKSFAEIGRIQSSPARTIASRVERGLERLRGLLSRRGVKVGMTLLVGSLTATASAAAPADLRATIRSWDSSGGASHTTAAGASSRALQWSKPRIPMTIIVSSAAAVGIALVASLLHLSSAETPPLATVATEPVPIAEPAPSPFYFDPLYQDTVAVVEMGDVSDTWRRIRELPEFRPFAPALEDWAWTQRIESIGAVRIAVDPNAMFTRDAQVGMRDLSLRIDETGMTPELFVESAKQEQPVYHVPELHGRITCADAGVRSELLEWLRADFGTRFISADWIEDGSWWRGSRGALSVTATTDGIALVAHPGHADRPWTWKTLPAASGSAAVNFTLWARPKDGGGVETVTSIAVDIGERGLRADLHVSHGSDRDKARNLGNAQFGVEAFASVPADALAAWAFALNSDSMQQSIFATFLFAARNIADAGLHDGEGVPAIGGLCDAITDILSGTTGTGLVVLRPGPMIPIMGLSLPEPAQAKPLFDALAGLGFSDNGSGGVQRLLGPVVLHVGIADGRLIITNAVLGISGLLQGEGSFAELPEVRDFLAARSTPKGYHIGVLRQGPLLDQIVPLVAAALDSDAQQQVFALQEELRMHPVAGGFLVSHKEKGIHAEAEGVLPVAAGVAIAAQHLGIPIGVN